MLGREQLFGLQGSRQTHPARSTRRTLASLLLALAPTTPTVAPALPLAAVATLLVCAPHTAHAQESIAGDMWVGNALFTIDDIDLLEDVCSMTPDQTELAKELLKGVRLKSRGVRKRWERAFEDIREKANEDGWETVQDDYKKMAEEMVAQNKALELEFVGDLRNLLSDEQVSQGWHEFERGRRRLLLRDDEAPVNADLLGMLRAAKVSKEQREAMKEVLEPYLTQLDGLIQERRPLQRDVGWSPSRYFRDSEPSEEAQKRYQDLTQRIGQLHVRTARLVEEKLEEPQRTAFLQQRLRIEWGEHYPDFIGWSRIQDVLRIRSLSPEQRQVIRQLVKASEEKLLPAAQALKARWDERVLTRFEDRDDEDDASFADFRKKTNQTRRQLLEDVLATLTTAQREHYDNGVDGTAENEDRMLAKRRYGENNWWADELRSDDREE